MPAELRLLVGQRIDGEGEGRRWGHLQITTHRVRGRTATDGGKFPRSKETCGGRRSQPWVQIPATSFLNPSPRTSCTTTASPLFGVRRSSILPSSARITGPCST